MQEDFDNVSVTSQCAQIVLYRHIHLPIIVSTSCIDGITQAILVLHARFRNFHLLEFHQLDWGGGHYFISNISYVHLHYSNCDMQRSNEQFGKSI